jgi:major intracellular serine protease
MNGEIRLIPYHLEEVIETTSEVPQGVKLIDSPQLWEKGIQGKGYVVAVIDTGCQPDHPDLKKSIIGGRNFTSDFNGDPSNFSDNNGHGTHVSGTIAAGINGTGVVGVAPEANLLILKVLNGNGSGSYEWIINAIHYAINWRGESGEKVRVISLSLGGPEDVPELHQAIIEATEKNISVVVAAGNEGDDQEETFERSYPGSYNEVIQVGAINFDKRLASFTNTNDEVDLVAPGVNILSTYPNSKYARLSGTSMAAPHVSGAIALLFSLTEEQQYGRRLTEPEIYAQLIKRTISLGYQKSSEGNGLIKLALVDKLNDLIQYIETNF